MSSLTWLDFGNLLEWCKGLPLKHKLPFVIQVTQPPYMNAVHMPEKIKQLGYERIKAAIHNIDDWQVTNINSLVDHVMNTPADPEMWKTMIRETNKLDRIRNDSILKYIPEYQEYWNDSTR